MQKDKRRESIVIVSWKNQKVFTNLYTNYAIGAEFGRKHPKLVNFIFNIFKFFALLISVVLWVGTCQGDLLITIGQSLGTRIISILYCLFVWGGMVGLIVLKEKKGMDLFRLSGIKIIKSVRLLSPCIRL